MKIAIYGKGGIGKSTIAANLSAALALQGKKVLQIGCDPKHDSTRLLLNGQRMVTALDYMKTTPVPLQRLDRVLYRGYCGIACAEAGGPEPGVGCAGRGILSTFALFQRLGLDMDAYDAVVYDVLGDVVCGGFAVPLRKGFADRVYVVTSEEFMSLYAANNILKGMKNFDRGQSRLAGLILNSRGQSEACGPVEQFARLTGLPVIHAIPRSDLFRQAERLEKTLVQAFPDSPEARAFGDLARDALENPVFFPARALDEAILEKQIFGKPGPLDQQRRPDHAAPQAEARGLPPGDAAVLSKDESLPGLDPDPALPAVPPPFLSKALLTREPLHGCAFSGALATTTQIRDAVTVAHGPRSCTGIAGQAVISAGLRRHSRTGTLLETQVAPRVISSDMDESQVIYGGRNHLAQTLEQAATGNPQAIFLVTTCPSGIIGDDPLDAVRDIRSSRPDLPVIPIASDGNLKGDYMQGVLNACMQGAAALIDRRVSQGTNMVNILAEKNIAANAETNFTTIAGLLDCMGIRVNCRFVRQTSAGRLKQFLAAPLNLPADTDYFGRIMTDFITREFGVAVADRPFPVGFLDTCDWVREIAAFFRCPDRGEALIRKYDRRYRAMLAPCKRALEGKTLMVITYTHNVDWIVEAAVDLGMAVAKVCILNSSQDNRFVTRFPGQFKLETGYDPQKRNQDLERLAPDLLLGNYTPKNLPFPLHADIIPMCPDAGFFGGLAFARRWAALVRAPVVEGWKNDQD